jgi:hypothetical protein
MSIYYIYCFPLFFIHFAILTLQLAHVGVESASQNKEFNRISSVHLTSITC